MRHSSIPTLLVVLSLAGCTYESHSVDEPLLATDGAVPTRDAGAPALDAGAPGLTDPLDPSGPGSDSRRSDFLEHEEVAVQATVRAWRERHLIHGDVSSPDTERCLDHFAGLETVSVPSEEFRRLCQRCDPDDTAVECEDLGRANACAPIERLRRPDGELEAEPRALNVVAEAFRPGTGVHRRLVIHETIHHLGLCTGEGMDHWHGNSHWWCTGGDVCEPGEAAQSINSRARAFATGRDE